MRKFTRGLATAAIAAALIAGPSAAAFAYAPTAPANGTLQVAPGGTITVPFTGFAPDARVDFVLAGGTNAGGATLASTSVITKTSDAAGAVSVVVTLPSNASGTYTLTGTDEFGFTATAQITVAATDAAAAPGGLANTGADSAAAFWFAGGLLALGATTVITLNVVRRNRAQA